MIYLLLAIACSAALSIVMRLSEGRVKSDTGMIATNYLTCIVIAYCMIGSDGIIPTGEAAPRTLGMGLVGGFFYMSSLLVMKYNIRKNGIVLPVIFQKLGLLVPLAMSILLFGERPTAVQVIGFAVSVAAIVLINYEKGHLAFNLPLLFLLFADGLAAAMSKVYDVFGVPELENHFLLFTFGSAFAFSILVVILKKERPGLPELLFGMLIGLPNFFASRFTLKALASIPAVIVYPSRGVGVILIITLTGLVFFKERLKKRQWIALALILASLVLLNI